MTAGARSATPTRRARRRAATYDEIVAAARTLLVAGQQPTIRGVAGAMDVSPAGLYRYVTSHDELLDLVAAAIDQSAAEELSAAADAEADAVARWLAAWTGLRRWALAHRAEFGLLLARPRSDGSPIRELSDAWLGRLLHAAWVEHDFPLPPTAGLDAGVLEQLAPHHSGDAWPPGLAWLHARVCASLHGTVALEVTGYVEPALVASGALFRASLVDWLARLGRTADLERLLRIVDASLAP